jgi:hypothetical protein
MSTEIVPAHLAVQAMRDNGYKNAAYAIAELMDNAIQAGATLVELLCAERVEHIDQRRRSRIYQVAVLDNGSGMNAEVLTMALQFGNGTNLLPEQQTGMGKFGMGLPSASISQCSRVEVWSWQNGVENAIYTYLDVNDIREGIQRSIPNPVRKAVPEIWQQVSEGFGTSGTLVVWSNLDRIIWRTSAAIIDNSEFLVGRMYRRFLENNRVRIRLAKFNADNPVQTIESRDAQPNDPGYLMERTSCPSPFNENAMFQPWGEEHYESHHNIEFRGEQHRVTLRFSYAKEEARQTPSAGARPHGQHAAKNIGISIMRAGRELDLDQAWVIKYDPTERWWGIEIEFPPALDELFGVTNNKQAARNFAELSKLDLETLLKDGVSYTAAMDELIDNDDPRAPLLEIAQRIRTNLNSLRRLLDQQTKGSRSGRRQRHSSIRPEAVATEITRSRQQEGFTGYSDRDETLSSVIREEAIERSLVDEGVSETAAHELAASTVSEGLKYVFVDADLETSAFFTVKPRGGALIITLNTNHPAYKHLVDVLEREEQNSDAENLQDRIGRAADGLKLLLSAWARYEDELPDGQPRTRAAEARSDWGRMARRFLEREE